MRSLARALKPHSYSHNFFIVHFEVADSFFFVNILHLHLVNLYTCHPCSSVKAFLLNLDERVLMQAWPQGIST
jgi:hypothetical protein